MDMLLRAAQQSPSSNWCAAESAAQGLASMAVALPVLSPGEAKLEGSRPRDVPPRRSSRRKRLNGDSNSEELSEESQDGMTLSDDGVEVNMVSPSIGSAPGATTPLAVLDGLGGRDGGFRTVDGLSLLSQSAPAHASMFLRRPFGAASPPTIKERARSVEFGVGFMDLDEAPRPPPPKQQRPAGPPDPVENAGRSTLVDGVPQPLSLDQPARPLLYEDLINFPRSRGKAHACRCVMCGHLASGEDATCSIPLQNKDVCKRCDTGIWHHTATLEYFKWCKGCKKFLHVCAFKEKLAKCTTKYSKQPSKCDRCRERGRQGYMRRKGGGSPPGTPRHEDDDCEG